MGEITSSTVAVFRPMLSWSSSPLRCSASRSRRACGAWALALGLLQLGSKFFSGLARTGEASGGWVACR
eukprot:5917557-Pyramimonas_sp.AAC.1